MPSVNLTAETYEKLKQLAVRKGRTPDELAETAVGRHLSDESMTDEEWHREWNAALAEIRSTVPSNVSVQELEADIDATLAEVRARHRARRS